ncbi:MAG: hypothetical protein U1E22_04915, partial [Coriobacteriia bacterium]|nr:hypothetical protein [Coriobacteriia bacterium]
GAFWPAVVFAGLGNAVFHLGGGVISLRIEPGRASLPGFFVAPGAAGLAIGIWMGANQWAPWLPAVALAVVIPFFRLAATVAKDGQRPVHKLDTRIPLLAVCVLFAVIVLRAFIGTGMAFPWKSEPALLWLLTAAVVLGKAAGGALADRFGRALVGVGALVLSAPLLMVGPSWAGLGIIGMLFFNMTMPVTLVALADRMPERPGFAFGLTCLALIAGGLPVALHLVGTLDVMIAGLLVLCSAGLLWLGLVRPWHASAMSVRLEVRS